VWKTPQARHEQLAPPAWFVAVSTTMEPDRASYVFAGYLVTKRDSGETSAEGIFPGLLSASPCLARFVPDTWALGWTSDTEDDRSAAAAALGMGPRELRGVIDLVTAGFDDGRFGWPNVVTSRQGLVDLLALLPARSWVALGLALRREHAPRYLEETAPRTAQQGAGGFHTVVTRGDPVPAGGTFLGFELLGFDGPSGQPHSWLCNRLDLTFSRTLGVGANASGFLPAEEAAEDASAQIAEGAVPCEPGLWLPFMMIDYTAEGRGRAG
jgi:hypothetical protein